MILKSIMFIMYIVFCLMLIHIILRDIIIGTYLKVLIGFILGYFTGWSALKIFK